MYKTYRNSCEQMPSIETEGINCINEPQIFIKEPQIFIFILKHFSDKPWADESEQIDSSLSDTPIQRLVSNDWILLHYSCQRHCKT